MYERIAYALGWTVDECRAVSLATLRELVRPIDPVLTDDISQAIAEARHLMR